jgi:hypothetical protein
MRLLTIFAIAFILWSCKSSNDDFDPFDEDFKFHNKMNKSEYDTIWDSCGYWTYEKDLKNGIKIAYGFYFDELVGKGFSLEIDKISTVECDSLFYTNDYHNVLARSLEQNPIESERIESRLSVFGVKHIKILNDTLNRYSVEIINSDDMQFSARITTDCDGNGYITRHIYFMNAKDSFED